MIKRYYSVSVIKANEGGGLQYRHFIMSTKSLLKKSAKEVYDGVYDILDDDKDYVIISLSRL